MKKTVEVLPMSDKDFSQPKIIAEYLLWPLWRGVSDDLKLRYMRDIWQIFENNIRSCTYTGSLSRFLNKATEKLGIYHEAQFIDQIEEITSSGQDYDILKMLRENSTLCVLYCRKINEERKQQFKDQED